MPQLTDRDLTHPALLHRLEANMAGNVPAGDETNRPLGAPTCAAAFGPVLRRALIAFVGAQRALVAALLRARRRWR